MKPIIDCPITKSTTDKITMAHGSGGVATERLIAEVFSVNFRNDYLDEKNDGAVIPIHSSEIAFSSDSFVVKPIFFPGGDIGSLSVNGTINDILCCGALPLYLSASFILEEGLEIYKLEKIVKSMAKAAKEGGIMIVTGDTKVVERGKCDGIYISTSGIGSILPNLNLSPKNIQHGDAIIVTAPIAEHGIAILTSREKLGFEGKVKSDTAPLRNMIINLLSKVQHISAIRDATRGGVATVLNEIASISKKAIIIDENILPISKHVAAASALLGLDPLYIANEGVMVVFVPEEYASTALSVIREDKYGKNAVIIGKVIKGEPGEVYLKTIVGTERNLPPLLREQLPRIC